MHDLHEQGATRQQIEHALVTLPYVRLYDFRLWLLTFCEAPCDDQGCQGAESGHLSQVYFFVSFSL